MNRCNLRFSLWAKERIRYVCILPAAEEGEVGGWNIHAMEPDEIEEGGA